jgi:hypothetical protein
MLSGVKNLVDKVTLSGPGNRSKLHKLRPCSDDAQNLLERSVHTYSFMLTINCSGCRFLPEEMGEMYVRICRAFSAQRDDYTGQLIG